MNSTPLVVALLLAAAASASAYKPVVFFHGFGFFEKGRGTSLEFASTTTWLHEAHPGQPTYALAVDNEFRSAKGMWTQVADFSAALRALVDSRPDEFANGFHVVSHSQGTLVARAVLQTADWDVDQYVSMAGVHGGYYGSCEAVLLPKLSCAVVTELLYTGILQGTLCGAGYWRTPSYSRYVRGNNFLALMNNEVASAQSDAYTRRLAIIRNITLIASPEDGVIMPWVSGLFGFFGDDGQSHVMMEGQQYYQRLGLDALRAEGKLTTKVVRNAAHNDWLYNRTLLEQHVFPLLS
eukprot:m51a1_g12312 hypothetical protein (294) ;mRNA; r:403255-404255